MRRRNMSIKSLQGRRCDVGPHHYWCLQNNPGANALNILQLLDATDSSTVQESIAVVNSSEDETTNQCLHDICQNEMTDVECRMLTLCYFTTS